MKQLWFGIGLLVFLILIGMLLANHLEQAHEPAAKDLQKAGACALKGDWDLAGALALRAKKSWQNHRPVTAMLAHHGPMDQVDVLFARLDIYRACQDPAAFSAACAELSRNLRAFSQSHRFSWQNLF